MSLYERITSLIREREELQDRLLGEEPTKEREIEVALASQTIFMQKALLEIARQLDRLETNHA